jgi:peroxiredoxin
MVDFTLPDLDGDKVNLVKYADGRPFVISFGTTSCPYCVLQVDAFREIRKRYGNDVAILGVNIGESARRVARHVEKIDSPFTTLIDERAEVYRRYGTGAVPLTIVCGADRQIVTGGGYLTADQLGKALETVLPKPDGA